MKEKLKQLGDFLLEVALFGFRVFLSVSFALVNELVVVLTKLDTLINKEITKVDVQVAKPVQATPTPTTPAPTGLTIN